MSTILIVDDEPAIRLLLREALESSGHRVLEAEDGVRGLATARSERPDAVLLDMALPRLSGLEVCRRLRDDPGTASMPVLLISGVAPEAERQAGEGTGAAAVIAKPFSPAALIAQVEGALERRATFAR